MSKRGNANTDTAAAAAAAAHRTQHAIAATPSPATASRLVQHKPKAADLLRVRTTAPATLAVERGISLVWLNSAPLPSKNYSPLNLVRGSITQRACSEQAYTPHSKTDITQHSRQTKQQHPNAEPNYSPNGRWKALTKWLLPRSALRSES